MAQSFNDVRDLVFLEDRVRNDGSIFKQWTMDLEFNIFTDQHNQDYWCKDGMYEVFGEQISLNHHVAKVFNQDKQCIGYAVLSAENTIDVDAMPKPIYFFKKEPAINECLYKRFRLNHNETYTFQFGEREYACIKGGVKEVQANQFIDAMQVNEEPVLIEEEEKNTGCFPSFRGFFKRHKSSESSSFSSSSTSSSEQGVEEDSSSRSSPSLSGLR